MKQATSKAEIPAVPEELICRNLAAYQGFTFMEPGEMSDKKIRLVLQTVSPVNLERNWVPSYEFDICLAAKGPRVGRIGFRVCLSEALSRFGGHIGYEIGEPYRGHRFAAKACRLLFGFVRRHGLKHVLFTCAEQNWASRKTIEAVGGRLLGIAETETDKKEMRPTCYYLADIPRA